MLIAEIFYSVQGEGELTGVPSVFIRTSGCNLRCAWCDTPYASWQPEGRNLSLTEILAEMQRYPARHCVLTGGEPMIARELPALAAALRERGYHITIETAGTVPPDGIACDLASLSPKLANSTPTESEAGAAWVERHEKTRLQPTVLAEWIARYDYQFKFVVAGRQDYAEVEAVLHSVGVDIPPARVHLMPEGTDAATLIARREELLPLCLEKGHRFCDRLHIHLFGNTRGT
jgi:7-carboxy-7-deazaguanine synthase